MIRAATALIAALWILGPQTGAPAPRLTATLDEIFADPVLARAVIGVRVESLRDGRVIYSRNAPTHVVPASNMKIVTMAVAAERLGWDVTFETRLEAAGRIADGVLTGDLVVTGSGDPTIVSGDGGPAPVFDAWAEAVRGAGITRVDGRLVGDDNAFDDEGIGAGWAWDYLGDGYATGTGALTYNENIVTVRTQPGSSAGDPVAIDVGPVGHGLTIVNRLVTGATGSAANVTMARLPGDTTLTIRGSLPAGAKPSIRTAAVDNPTTFFVSALALALARHGVVVRDGAVDIDAIKTPPSGTRTLITKRTSLPLSIVGAEFLKVSQNLYGETLLKTLGRKDGVPGTAEGGRQAVRETLAKWGVPDDAIVMYDGSGLSRYNYVSADAIVAILRHVWEDARLRGPFLSALPVGGHDGTLDTRMKNTILDGKVQAKTGTISNVRSLSGFLETASGEKIVVSMIATHFTAPSARIDAVVEKALAAIAGDR